MGIDNEMVSALYQDFLRKIMKVQAQRGEVKSLSSDFEKMIEKTVRESSVEH